MKTFFVLLAMLIFSATSTAQAAGEKILFIPHDDRPISYHQTVEVVEAAGYEMLLPPKELLSNATNMGHPDELWAWLFENAPGASSAIIASDSMLYGGLIPSRKHEVSEEVLNARLTKFEELKKKNPGLQIYVFDSLMRTPYMGYKGNIEEPEYYAVYGGDIFQYTRLLDKKEISKLNKDEEFYLESYKKKIPEDVWKDWIGRRDKNVNATKNLMDYTRDGVIDYLILGRDDNAPISQTHRENREILAYAEKNNLPKTKFQSMPGIDEFNILLLTRAINDMNNEIPFVHVQYNKGKGGDTVPAYSDEKISESIKASITIAGGILVPDPKRADVVLLVNTDKDGKTVDNVYESFTHPEGGEFIPNLKPTANTKYFAKLVEECVGKNYPVVVADICLANGSDNALMEILRKKDLLFKLQAYSGWNTATNSTGFAIGTGMLAKKMTPESKKRVLSTRYLDDWAYQANVRPEVVKEGYAKFGNLDFYFQLDGDKLAWAENRNIELMRDFAAKNLLQITEKFTVKNPWIRMFECDIIFER